MGLTMLAGGMMLAALAAPVDGQAAEEWYFQAQAPAVVETAADRVTPVTLIAGDSGFRPWDRGPAEPVAAKVKRDC